jgi:predicted Zn-dependent protease
VAAILAHEAGHVLYRHPVEQMFRVGSASILIGLFAGDFAGSTILVGVAQALIRSHYSREAELEADAAAFAILTRAGLSSEPFARFMDRLSRMAEEAGLAQNWLSTHPYAGARADFARRVPRLDSDPLLSPSEWVALQGICSETAPLPE